MARRGPQPKDVANTKSVHVGFRMTPQLHELLVEEAQKAGRSLSQEIDFRLRRSFEFEGPHQQLKDRFGGETTYWVFLIAGNLVRRLENFTGERWWRDPYTHRQLKVLMATILDCFKPDGRPRTPTKFVAINEPLGQHLAERELANIESTLFDSNPPIGLNWGGMTVTEWRRAADWFKGKLKKSPLAKLYGIERTEK
jgi:TraY domain